MTGIHDLCGCDLQYLMLQLLIVAPSYLVSLGSCHQRIWHGFLQTLLVTSLTDFWSLMIQESDQTSKVSTYLLSSAVLLLHLSHLSLFTCYHFILCVYTIIKESNMCVYIVVDKQFQLLLLLATFLDVMKQVVKCENPCCLSAHWQSIQMWLGGTLMWSLLYEC